MLIQQDGQRALSRYLNRGDLFSKRRLCLCRTGAVLALKGELVLFPARDSVLGGHVFRRDPHMLVAERVSEHGNGSVDQGSVTQPRVGASVEIQEGHRGHRLVATSEDDVGSSP